MTNELYNKFFIMMLLVVSKFILYPSIIFAVSIVEHPFDNHVNINSKMPWNIMANRIDYHIKDKLYKLVGNVTILKKNIKIKSNFILFDHSNMIIHSFEDTFVYIGEDLLTSSFLSININSETGTLLNGRLLLKNKHMRFKGKKITKINSNTYIIDKGSLTTCSGKDPTWSIFGEFIHIEKGKYITLKNALLKIKNVPVLYLPYFLISTTQRQSGLLTPEIKHEGGQGLSYCQPFFYVINDYSDLTFSPRHILNNGFSTGLEYRYLLGDEIKFICVFNLSKSKKKVSKLRDDYCIVSDFDNLNRYWLCAKYVHKFPMKLLLKLGIDFVSDSNYLEESKNQYSGIHKIEQQFKKIMEKDLLPYNDGSRYNYLMLTKTLSKGVLNVASYWTYINFKSMKSEGTDFLKRKILLQFDSIKYKLIDSLPLYFDIRIKDEYFNDDNMFCDSNKAEFESTVYVPCILNRFISMNMSFGSHQILGNSGRLSDFNNYNLKLDLFSEFSKVFDYKENLKGFKSLKHSIKLQTTYEYIPKGNYKSLNLYGGRYVKEAEHVLTYAINQTLILKSTNKLLKMKDEKYHYLKLCSFHLKQNFKKNKTGHQFFSDILGEVYISLSNNLLFKTYTEWNPYKKSISKCGSELFTKNNLGYYISIGYAYDENKVKLLKTIIGTPLNRRLSAMITCEYDILKNKRKTEGLELSYKANCWSAKLNYKADNDEDHSISISIELLGIGNYNKEISNNVAKSNFLDTIDWYATA